MAPSPSRINPEKYGRRARLRHGAKRHCFLNLNSIEYLFSLSVPKVDTGDMDTAMVMVLLGEPCTVCWEYLSSCGSRL